MKFNLDHFYSSFPSQVFDELKNLEKIFSNSNYAKKEREDISYEGVYIQTEGGHYIELVRDNDRKYVNFAMNCFDSPDLVAEKLDNPNSEQYYWFANKIVKTPKNDDNPNKDWFNSFSLINKNFQNTGTYKYPSEGIARFWIINYQNKEFNRVLTAATKISSGEDTSIGKTGVLFDVIQVHSIVVIINQIHYDYLLDNLKWSSTEIMEQNNQLSGVLSNPNGQNIPVVFLVDNDSNLGFQKIVLQIRDPVKFMGLSKVGPITFSLDEDLLTLQFDDYWERK